ncbi:MAG: hypothetical protein K0U72_10905 [Gammaproteobacteria bacterium]|nr:hypothetical protein [Gammaproteobacteria bacterium]
MKKLLVIALIAAAGYYQFFAGSLPGAYASDGTPQVMFFTTGQCGGACDQMRSYLKSRLPFEEHDAFEDEQGRELYLEFGGKGYLPFVVIGEQRVIGPDTGGILSAMAIELGPEQLKPREQKALRRHFDASGDPVVVMYATDWCGYCKKARQYFVDNNVRFVEYDIEKDRAAKRDYEVLRGNGTPLLYQGFTRVSGFDVRQIERTFEL